MGKDELWKIANRPSTKTKLEILRKVFSVWLTVWNNQGWVKNEWYVVDLFAGRGKYIDNKTEVFGSPLIFLDVLKEKIDKLKPEIKIILFLVEKDKDNFNLLKENVNAFIKNYPSIQGRSNICYINDDCNNAIDKIIEQIQNSRKYPLFLLIDPTGLQIKRMTVDKILALQNPKDIMFNYILEGVRRTAGVAKKAYRGEELNLKEIKTIETLYDFIGLDVEIINKSDLEVLKNYCESVFLAKGLNIVAYDISYPDRKDTLYYLLFASRKLSISKIVKDIYAKQKEKTKGKTLFGGKEFYKINIISVGHEIQTIKRKSLLYETKVEYGNWTINHVVGCMHGCRFPCYAMMMAKKFGWVKDYEDWRNPRIVENALELIEVEIPKYKDKIDFVHLCFMTDPFMYNHKTKEPIPQIKEMTLKIIEKLNKEGIKVTTLTKGIYPEELLDNKRFSKDNEYGITLASLNEQFKKQFEPYSAYYNERILSLRKLSDNGLKTWVSIEPYPTTQLDPDAFNIEKIFEKISFVKKLIFGKLNYNRMVQYGEKSSDLWKNNQEFYKQIAQKVIDFCIKNSIEYHIKEGTPLSNSNFNIFKK